MILAECHLSLSLFTLCLIYIPDCVKPHPYNAGEIWNLKKQLLRLGLPSSLIHHENGAFQNCSSNRRNMKTPTWRLVLTENILKTELFRKRWCGDNVTFLRHKSNMASDCCVFKFLRRRVDRKLLMCFQGKSSSQKMTWCYRSHTSCKKVFHPSLLLFSIDYPHDPYSDKNPYNSICSRGDLLIPSDRSPDGCYDTKVRFMLWNVCKPSYSQSQSIFPHMSSHRLQT